MGSGVKYIVQMPRIHSSECQIFINDIRLTGVSQFEISKEREVLHLRGLNSLVVEDRISKNQHKISTSISWTLGNGTTDPFFDISTGSLVSIEEFSIKAKDFVGSNIVSGAYVNSYEITSSVGDVIKGTVKYEADSYSWDTGTITYSDQSNDSCLPFLTSSMEISSNNDELDVSSIDMSIQNFSFTYSF